MRRSSSVAQRPTSRSREDQLVPPEERREHGRGHGPAKRRRSIRPSDPLLASGLPRPTRAPPLEGARQAGGFRLGGFGLRAGSGDLLAAGRALGILVADGREGCRRRRLRFGESGARFVECEPGSFDAGRHVAQSVAGGVALGGELEPAATLP